MGRRPWTLAGVLVLALGCPADDVGGDGSTGEGSSSTSGSGGTTAPTSVGEGSTSATSGTVTSTTNADSSSSSGGESSSSTGVELPEGCDVFAQDCPDGFKCAPFANDGGNSWNDLRCVPVVPEPVDLGGPCMVEGEPASGIDDCGVGEMCFNVDPDTGIGECNDLCGGTPEEPTCQQEGAACSISATGPINICLLPCDPLAASCDTNEVCAPVGVTPFACVPAAGAVAEGEGCEFVNQCAAGLGCFPAAPGFCGEDDASCCLPYCDVTVPDCPDGLTCMSYWKDGEPAEGFEDVGVCLGAG